MLSPQSAQFRCLFTLYVVVVLLLLKEENNRNVVVVAVVEIMNVLVMVEGEQ